MAAFMTAGPAWPKSSSVITPDGGFAPRGPASLCRYCEYALIRRHEEVQPDGAEAAEFGLLHRAALTYPVNLLNR